jgi:hypothetical protein
MEVTTISYHLLSISYLSYVPPVLVKEPSFQYTGQFHYCLVVLIQGIACFCRENGDPVVDTVMKGKVMTFEAEFPIDRVKVIFFVGEPDIEILAQDVGNMVELFQSAVIGNNGFGTAKGGS